MEIEFRLNAIEPDLPCGCIYLDIVGQHLRELRENALVSVQSEVQGGCDDRTIRQIKDIELNVLLCALSSVRKVACHGVHRIENSDRTVQKALEAEGRPLETAS